MEPAQGKVMAGNAIRALGIATALVVVVGAGQASAVDETRDLRADLARLQTELEAVTAERDALREDSAARAERHRRSSAAQQAIIDIIADPTALGGE